MTTADAHPPAHVLADLAEGVLDDAQAREVQAHVDQCATCRATLDELAQVTVALRGLPAELPIPEFVAARISHALAAERSSGAAGSAGAAGGAAGAGGAVGADGGTVAWFRRRLPQSLAAAASVAVLGLAGYVAVESGGGGDDSDGGSSGDDAAVAGGPATRFGTESDGSAREGAPDTTAMDAPEAPTPEMGSEETTPSRIDSAELTAAVEAVVQDPATPVTDTCGDDLSEEVGLPLVGSTFVGSGVLVVLEDATTYDGWLLYTCNSTSNETLEPQVEVPKSE